MNDPEVRLTIKIPGANGLVIILIEVTKDELKLPSATFLKRFMEPAVSQALQEARKITA